MPCRQNVQRRIVIGIGFKSASCTLEFCLRLSVLPVCATATTTRPARALLWKPAILRQAEMVVEAAIPREGYCISLLPTRHGHIIPQKEQKEALTFGKGSVFGEFLRLRGRERHKNGEMPRIA